MHTKNGKTSVVGLSRGNDERSLLGDQEIEICDEFQQYLRLSNYLDFIEKYVGTDYCV